MLKSGLIELLSGGLSPQTNASHGVDVLLPDNAVIWSSRYEVDERTRYSYIDADGETVSAGPQVHPEHVGPDFNYTARR